MEMTNLYRRPQPSSSPPPPDSEPFNGSSSPTMAEKSKPSSGKLGLALVLVGLLVLLPFFMFASGFRRSLLLPHPPLQLQAESDKGRFELSGGSKSSNASKDPLLAGLLASGFDKSSCLSRYQSASYRKVSPHSLSPHLLEKVRNYESVHKRCGPNTEAYNMAVQRLKPGQNGGTHECKYVMWISYSGLGNRILTLTSVFLYALLVLTDRILLIDRGTDMADLFCEPFPESSWLLPSDFPLNPINTFVEKSRQSYENMVKNKLFNGNSLPSNAYLHLAHDYGDFDKLFFCEEDQLRLEKIPWLVVRSDNYFTPSLFLIPKYEEELHRLFPPQRHGFPPFGSIPFPPNTIWGLITRLYQAYLAGADEILGIQVRIFGIGVGPFQHVLDQILTCSLREKLLPEISKNETNSPATTKKKSKAVLVTSLNSGYFKYIRNMYWGHPIDTQWRSSQCVSTKP